MSIEIGQPAISRQDGVFTRTQINKGGTATATGTITSIEVYATDDLTDFVVGIFYTTNGDTLKCRSAYTIGAVTGGSKQTFPLDPAMAVVTGDYLGHYATARVEKHPSGYSGVWYGGSGDDHCVVDDETAYSTLAGDATSVFGTGEEGAPPSGSLVPPRMAYYMRMMGA